MVCDRWNVTARYYSFADWSAERHCSHGRHLYIPRAGGRSGQPVKYRSKTVHTRRDPSLDDSDRLAVRECGHAVYSNLHHYRSDWDYHMGIWRGQYVPAAWAHLNEPGIGSWSSYGNAEWNSNSARVLQLPDRRQG